MKISLTKQTYHGTLRTVEAYTSMDEVLLQFSNGAVMSVPFDRDKPVPETFILPNPEGLGFIFGLQDAQPGGRLVYREQEKIGRAHV